MDILDYEANGEDAKRLIFDLTTMLDIGKTLNSSLSLDDVLDIIILTCNGHFHASDAIILLSEESGGQTHYKYESESQKILLKPEHPFTKYIQENQHILHIDDLKEEDIQDVVRQFKKDRIELIVPLQFKGQINGILCLKNKEPDFGTTYTTGEQRFIDILAGFASVAIENARLYEMATLDRKTKLFNHGYFQNRLMEEIERAERYRTDLALIMMDLDHFKKVNDTYGHVVGDEVLIKVAKTIQEQVRSFDIPARFGGEEFTVILPETNSESAIKVAERLRHHIGKLAFTTPKGNFSVTVSIGISNFRHSASITEDIFIEQADKSLYYAKQHGRNQVVVYSNIAEHLNI
jgi:diguanylate cyclase (GGDEF)-like protein